MENEDFHLNKQLSMKNELNSFKKVQTNLPTIPSVNEDDNLSFSKPSMFHVSQSDVTFNSSIRRSQSNMRTSNADSSYALSKKLGMEPPSISFNELEEESLETTNFYNMINYKK